MAQSLIPIEQTGTRRMGAHAGGQRQRYVLDESGRRLLLARYDGRTETIDELAMRLGVPRWTVKKWGCQLGLARQKEPPWSAAELTYLESQLGRMALAEIARRLGRTKVAVQIKAKRLGLSKCADGYTMHGLCLGLGCDHHKVERWLAAGWLRGTRRQTERTEQQGGDVWLFSDAAIRELVRQHPNQIDPRRADWLWLVDVLLGGPNGIGSLDG